MIILACQYAFDMEKKWGRTEKSFHHWQEQKLYFHVVGGRNNKVLNYLDLKFFVCAFIENVEWK